MPIFGIYNLFNWKSSDEEPEQVTTVETYTLTPEGMSTSTETGLPGMINELSNANMGNLSLNPQADNWSDKLTKDSRNLKFNADSDRIGTYQTMGDDIDEEDTLEGYEGTQHKEIIAEVNQAGDTNFIPNAVVEAETEITSEVEEIHHLYQEAEGTGFILDRISLKENIKKLIFTKKDGPGDDNVPLSDTMKEVNMSITIDGISGIKPGDIFQTDYMPLNYNKEVIDIDSKADLGPPSYFKVISHTQEVSDSGWTTKIEGLIHPNTDAMKSIQKMRAAGVYDYFRLTGPRSFGINQLPFDFISKISGYIEMADQFLQRGKGFMKDATKYREDQKVLKSLANAETEAEKQKIRSEFDGEVFPKGEYNGGFFGELAQVAGATVHAAGVGIGAGLSGAATIAKGVGVGFGKIGAEAATRPFNFLGEDREEPVADGKTNPAGGTTVTEKIKKTDVGGQSDKLPINVQDEKTEEFSPWIDIKNKVLGLSLNNYFRKKAKERRQKNVKVANSTGVVPEAKALLEKITFTDEEGLLDEGTGGLVTVTITTEGFYKGEIISEMGSAQSTTVKKAIDIAKKENRDKIANAFYVKFPNDPIASPEGGVAGDGPQNPGYPFTGENFGKSPFGGYESAELAREAQAAAFGFDSWSAYTDVANGGYDNQTRKNHWDGDSSLWSP